jgi:hypothetical protein
MWRRRGGWWTRSRITDTWSSDDFIATPLYLTTTVLPLKRWMKRSAFESTSIRLSAALVVVSRANELVERMRRRAEWDPAERANQVADAAVSCALKGRREVWSSAHLRRSSSASADTASRSLGEAKCMSRKPRRLVGGVDMGAWWVVFGDG